MNRALRAASTLAVALGALVLVWIPFTGGPTIEFVALLGMAVGLAGMVALVVARRPPVFALTIAALLVWVALRRFVAGPTDAPTDAPTFLDPTRSVFDVLFSLLLVGVVIRMVELRRGGVPAHVVIDGLNALLGGALAAWVLVVEPLAASGTASWGDTLLAGSRVPLGVLLLAASGSLVASGLHRSRAAWCLVVAFAAGTAGTLMSGLAAAGRTATADPGLLAGTWFVVIAFTTAAMVHPAISSDAAPTVSPAAVAVRLRVAILVGCSAIPLALVAAIPGTSLADRVVRTFGTVAIAAIAGWRILHAVRASDRAADELQLRDHHDDLTRLPNRRQLVTRLADSLEPDGADALAATSTANTTSTGTATGPGTASTDRRPCLVLVNIDRFKNINDSLGHDAANEILLVVAHRLQALAAATGATVARISGDEFAVMDPTADGDAARARAEGIRIALSDPIEVDGQRVFVTASIGLVVAPDPHPEHRRVAAEELLRRADIAVHTAKADGRNRVAVFDESMQAELASRMDIEHALHGAIERDELRLVHQPIVDSTDGTLHGVEALMRWQRADGTLMPPNEFIPIAEETGLIDDLGAWALLHALADLRRWIDDGIVPAGTTMSVNVSPRQVADPSFVDIVHEALARAGVAADALWLEVTESMMLTEPERVRSALRQLRAMGVRIALDDFGTGFSSLSLVQHFPLNRLKIDRAFVHGVAEEGHDRSLVRTIIAMGISMGMDVVAEGVESVEQLEAVRALGCPKAQGYLIGRPVPAEALPAALRAIDELRARSVFAEASEHPVGT